jgi:hypothetical protein
MVFLVIWAVMRYTSLNVPYQDLRTAEGEPFRVALYKSYLLPLKQTKNLMKCSRISKAKAINDYFRLGL